MSGNHKEQRKKGEPRGGRHESSSLGREDWAKKRREQRVFGRNRKNKRSSVQKGQDSPLTCSAGKEGGLGIRRDREVKHFRQATADF